MKKYDSGPIDQTWMSVDGTRDGLTTDNNGIHGIIPGCPPGRRCTPVPAYFPSIPATAPAIVRWLEKITGITLVSGANYASAVGDVLDQDYLPPAQQSQLYHFLASSHKLVAVPHIADPLGRPGVGVAWTVNDVTYTLIFDTKSYTYLGFSEGEPHWGVAMEKIAIVDHAGELPTP